MDHATFTAAKAGDREAIASVFGEHLPFVWRAAHALAPGEAEARRIVASVLRRAGGAADTWRDEADVTRWFRHHTIQTLRRGPAPSPRPGDPLAIGDDPETLAAVAALRKLPRQQQEAIVLRRGEGLGDRAMGIAMDCSVAAAVTHLEGGQKGLREVAGDDLGGWLTRIGDAYQRQTPPANVAISLARRHAPRFRRLKQIALWLAAIGLTLLVLAAGWLAMTRVEF